MKIVRSDTVGQVDMRLVCRPTNTCVGVNNYHIWVSFKDMPTRSVVVFFGQSRDHAEDEYDLERLKAIDQFGDKP